MRPLGRMSWSRGPRRHLYGLVLALMSVLTMAPPAPASAPAPVSGYIVVLEPSEDVAAAAAQARRLGADVSLLYRHAARGYSAIMSDEEAAGMALLPGVAWVEHDVAGAAVGQILPTGVDRVEADRSKTARLNGKDDRRIDVDIAVLDTGVDVTHPDLNVAGSHSCFAGADGTVDVDGHGTFVAGNAAAIDNGSFVVGVAPGARVWGVQIGNNNGVGNVSAGICGIDWVTSTRTDSDPSNDIEVINMSWIYYEGGGNLADDRNCGLTNKDALHLAICRAVANGITVVVAAGNDHVDAAFARPQAYDEVITVSALQDLDGRPGGLGTMFPRCSALLPDGYEAGFVDDTMADFSNFGADIDLIAPGDCVWSLISSAGDPDGDGLHLASGTSFSSPYVAGAAALYIAKHRGATPAQVRSALIARGSFNWDESDDPDGIKEPLLDVSSL